MSVPMDVVDAVMLTDVTERIADEAAAAIGGAGWVAVVGDVGRQYAWPVWNTLVARSLLADAGLSLPAVAFGGTEIATAVARGGRVAGPMYLAHGQYTRVRTARAGRPLPPGELPLSPIMLGDGEVTGFRMTPVWLVPQAIPVADAGWLNTELQGVTGSPGLPLGATALAVAELVAGAADVGGGPLMQGLDVPVTGRWWDLLTGSAAVAVLAAHGRPGRVDKVADLAGELFGHLPAGRRAAAVLDLAERVLQVTRRVLGVASTMHWAGGMATVPAPMVGITGNSPTSN